MDLFDYDNHHQRFKTLADDFIKKENIKTAYFPDSPELKTDGEAPEFSEQDKNQIRDTLKSLIQHRFLEDQLLSEADFTALLFYYILTDEGKMLLDADLYNRQITALNVKEQSLPLPPAFFELSSGKFRKKFVTVWELFDSEKKIIFSRIITSLANKAVEIYKQTPYSIIVTCTDTAKELLKYVLPLIEQKINHYKIGGNNKETADSSVEEIAISHFGNYPSNNVSQKDIDSFFSKHVLIFTDVIASGNLVKLLGEIVEKLGGHVSSVLALVLTVHQDQLDENIIREQGKFKVKLNNSVTSEKNKQLNAIAYIPLRHSTNIPEDARIFKISQNTIYPEDIITIKPPALEPLFNLQETISHFEKADAFRYGFYEGDRFYTTKVEIDNILNINKAAIQEKLEEKVFHKTSRKKRRIVITTYIKEDVALHNFFEEEAMQSSFGIEKYYTIKRESQGSAYLQDATSFELEDLSQTRVFLLISFATNNEILSNIISLIAQNKPYKITIICLINRMGVNTSSFVQRIRLILKGLTPEEEPDPDPDKKKKKEYYSPEKHARFEFVPIYNLSDLPHENLIKMHRYFDNIVAKFKNTTAIPNFNRLTDRIHEKLRPRPFTSNYFFIEDPEKKEISRIRIAGITINGKLESSAVTIASASLQSRLYLITYQIAINRDYHSLISELESATDTGILFHLYGLLLAGIDDIRTIRHDTPPGTDHLTVFSTCIAVLRRRIEQLREERFLAEELHDKSAKKSTIFIDKIKSNIRLEANIILGLNFLSNFDKKEKYEDDFLSELFTEGNDARAWRSFPQNFKFQFSEERLVWAVSFLIHTVHYKFNKPNAAPALKRSIGAQLYGMKALITRLRHKYKGLANRKLRKEKMLMLAKCENNIDMVLEDVGYHSVSLKHQKIRFLHKYVITDTVNHNPINTALIRLRDNLEAAVSKAELELGQPIEKNQPVKLTKDFVEKYVDEANYEGSLLERISEAVLELYQFTPLVPAEDFRFHPKEKNEGFDFDVALLNNYVNDKIKSTGEITKNLIKDLSKVVNRICNDLFQNEGDLRDILTTYYIISLTKTLEEVLDDTAKNYSNKDEKNIHVKKEHIQDLFFQVRQKLDKLDKQFQVSKLDAFSYDVLIDRLLLREVLRNIFDNALKYGINLAMLHESSQEARRMMLDVELVTVENNRPFRYVVDGGFKDELIDGIRLELTILGNEIDMAKIEGSTFEEHQSRVTEYGGRLHIVNLDRPAQGTKTTLTLIARANISKAINRDKNHKKK